MLTDEARRLASPVLQPADAGLSQSRPRRTLLEGWEGVQRLLVSKPATPTQAGRWTAGAAITTRPILSLTTVPPDDSLWGQGFCLAAGLPPGVPGGGNRLITWYCYFLTNPKPGCH